MRQHRPQQDQHPYLSQRRRVNDRLPAALSVANLCQQYGVDAVLEAVLKDQCGCPEVVGYIHAYVAACLLDRQYLVDCERHLQVSTDEGRGRSPVDKLGFHELVLSEQMSLDGRRNTLARRTAAFDAALLRDKGRITGYDPSLEEANLKKQDERSGGLDRVLSGTTEAA